MNYLYIIILVLLIWNILITYLIFVKDSGVKSSSLIKVLIFVLLLGMLAFIGIECYKIAVTNNMSNLQTENANFSLGMMQIFIAMFGVLVVIIAYFSYDNIKREANNMAKEVAKKVATEEAKLYFKELTASSEDFNLDRTNSKTKGESDFNE